MGSWKTDFNVAQLRDYCGLAFVVLFRYGNKMHFSVSALLLFFVLYIEVDFEKHR